MLTTNSSSQPDKAAALGNAVPFDLHMSSTATQVQELSTYLFTNCISRKHGPRHSKIADVIIAVLCNLIAARHQDTARFVRFSRRNGRYKRGRYNPQYIGVKNLTTVVDALVIAGLVELHLGIPAPDGFKGGKQSRIRATAKLVRLIDEFQISPSMSDRVHDEIIILRGQKDCKGYAKQIDYPETRSTTQMRKNLELINARIAAIDPGIDIQLSHEQMHEMNEQLIRHPDKDPFDPTRITLRRVFNNGSFQEGGRFYHGWWQNIPRRYRSWIQINGRVTREVDYSAIHFAIFYAEVGLPLEEDPYSLPGTTRSDRNIIKKALNAAINAESDKQAERAIRKESNFSYELPETYPTARRLLDALIKRHKPIADFIGTGAGRRGQYIDSRIAEKVMLRLGDQGIIVLPVHDSFIVEHDRVDELKVEMTNSFQHVVKAECNVEVKTPAWEEPGYEGVFSPTDFREIWPEMDLRGTSLA